MAEWEIVQERLISGKGVLKVPTDAVKNRAYVLFATVVRQPKNKYLNFNWNPARSRYGNMVFLREGYVIDTLPIEFPKQVFDGVNDISGQTLIAIKCAYEGILQTFVNLGNGLAGTPGGIGLSVTPITDLIKDYENLRLAWDEIRLQCYADTAISLRLSRLKYDTCDEDKDKDKPPPPPPDPIEPIEPGTPIETDEPYDEDTSDDGNTKPFPGDEPLPPTPCITTIRGAGLNSDTCGALSNFGDYPFEGYGTLVPVTVPPNGCAGLRLYIDGVDQGVGLTFYTTAVVLSREGDCVPPPE